MKGKTSKVTNLSVVIIFHHRQLYVLPYCRNFGKTLLLTLSILTGIFPDEPGIAGYIEAKNNGSGGDNWSCKLCKLSSPTNQHPTFYRPDALPVAQPTTSEN